MFFAKLGIQNLRKNQAIYLPFLISMIFIVAINTMIHLLIYNDGMETLGTREGVKVAFRLGQVVIILFSWIFSIYVHRFLLKQRTRELGLYNVLGLGKKELYLISFWETCYSFLLSISFGLISGFVLFKLISLILTKMFEIGEKFHFQIEIGGFLLLCGQFLLIFVLLFLLNCRYIHKTNPLELLSSSKKGEREPKSKGVLTSVGLIALIAGYFIAVTIRNPFDAMLSFVIAVLLVILATYTLFIGGSVTLLKKLKKQKKIYYRPQAFLSISSMIHRMKQNAAGLASICILSTMALITVSTTASLYFGRETDLNIKYPYDFSFATTFDNQNWINAVNQLAEEEGVQITKTHRFKTSEPLLYQKEKGVLKWIDEAGISLSEARKVAASTYYVFLSLDEYNQQTGKKETLKSDEVLIEQLSKNRKETTLNFGDNQIFHVKNEISGLETHQYDVPFTQMVFVVMANEEIITQIFNTTIPEYYQENTEHRWWYQFNFNFKTSEDLSRNSFASQVSSELSEIGDPKSEATGSGYSYRMGSRDEVGETNRDFDSSFFFIGILLSVIFLLGTVVIIYYKQISEGLEDRNRFIILQKVGMSHKEVKRTIHQQVLIIFSLPLLTAFCHLIFAFPMMKQLLVLFEIEHSQVFLYATILVSVIFAVIYFLVYLLTARTYYKIVERESF